MKKKLLTLAVSLMAFCQAAFAISWNDNGLTYTTIPGTTNQVSVKLANLSQFNGVIQDTVENSNVKYAVVKIEYDAFSVAEGTRSIPTLTIPATVKTIDEYAFYNCVINTLNWNSTSMTTIGNNAFGGNANITEVINFAGNAAQWSALPFASQSASPVKNGTRVAVKDGDDFKTFIGKDTETVTFGETTVVRRTEVLEIPATATTLNRFAFGTRAFVTIKVHGAVRNINANTFRYIDSTKVLTECAYLSGYESNSVWSRAKLGTFVDDSKLGSNFTWVKDSVNANNEKVGGLYSVSGANCMVLYIAPSCDNNSTWTLQAIPNAGYTFNRWDNNNTNATITGTPSTAKPTGAITDMVVYNLTVSTENSNFGTVTPTTMAATVTNPTVTVTAQPKTGYKLGRWSDGFRHGNTYNVNAMKVSSLTAYFESTTPFSKNSVYSCDFSDAAHENHLWAYINDDTNAWSINSGALMIGDGSSYVSTVNGSLSFAYRVVTLKSGVKYNMDLNYKGGAEDGKCIIAYAMVPNNGSNEKNLVEGITSWKLLSAAAAATDTTIADIAMPTADGEYILVFAWKNDTKASNTNYNAADAAVINSVSIYERKFDVAGKAGNGYNLCGTFSGNSEVFNGDSTIVTVTANQGYKFTGWYTDEACTIAARPGAAKDTIHIKALNNEKTYYAKFDSVRVVVLVSNDQKGSHIKNAAGALDTTYITGNSNSIVWTAKKGSGMAGIDTLASNRGMRINARHNDTLEVYIDETNIIAGWQFKEWNDGDTNAVRYIGLRSDMDTLRISPVFEKKSYKITAKVCDFENAEYREDNTMGTIAGAGTYTFLDSVTLVATPKTNYTFVEWVDNGNNTISTDSIYKLRMNNQNLNLPLRALFEVKKYDVKIVPNNSEFGAVSFADAAHATTNWIEGQGQEAKIPYRSVITIKATAFSGYKFNGWNVNGNLKRFENYTFSPNADLEITADFIVDEFVAPDTDRVVYYDTIRTQEVIYDTITDSITVNIYDTLAVYLDTIYDTTRVYLDTNTIIVYDTTCQVTDTVTLTEYITDTVTVTEVDTIEVLVPDTTVSPIVVYRYDTITLPVYVYDTVHQPYYVYDTIHVTIEVSDDAKDATIYASDGQIVVDGVDGESVVMYDAVGRSLAVRKDVYGTAYFDVPADGVYLVRVGQAKARKIVVKR